MPLQVATISWLMHLVSVFWVFLAINIWLFFFYVTSVNPCVTKPVGGHTEYELRTGSWKVACQGVNNKYCMLVANHPNHAPLTSGIKALQSTTSCSNLPGELQRQQGLIFTLKLSFFTQLLPSFGASHMMLLSQPVLYTMTWWDTQTRDNSHINVSPEKTYFTRHALKDRGGLWKQSF